MRVAWVLLGIFGAFTVAGIILAVVKKRFATVVAFTYAAMFLTFGVITFVVNYTDYIVARNALIELSKELTDDIQELFSGSSLNRVGSSCFDICLVL